MTSAVSRRRSPAGLRTQSETGPAGQRQGYTSDILTSPALRILSPIWIATPARDFVLDGESNPAAPLGGIRFYGGWLSTARNASNGGFYIETAFMLSNKNWCPRKELNPRCRGL